MPRYLRPLSAQIVEEWLLSAEKKAELLRPSARKGLDDPSDFYYLKDSAEDVLIDEEDCADDATNDFVICSVCGAISTEADTKFKPLCEHSESNYRRLRKIEQHKNHVARCPCLRLWFVPPLLFGKRSSHRCIGNRAFRATSQRGSHHNISTKGKSKFWSAQHLRWHSATTANT